MLVSFLWDQADKVIIAGLVVMAAIDAISVQAVANEAVPGTEDIQNFHIRWITGAFEPKSFDDLQLIRLIIFSLARGESIGRPAKFKVHSVRPQFFQDLRY